MSQNLLLLGSLNVTTVSLQQSHNLYYELGGGAFFYSDFCTTNMDKHSKTIFISDEK